jgi:hypothetical protein
MRAERVVLWILWALGATTLSLALCVSIYYRPTVYHHDVLIDPRSVAAAAKIGAVIYLFVLGLALFMLLRTRSRQ